MSDESGLDLLRRIAGDRLRRVRDLQVRIPGWTLRERLGTAPPAGRLERALRRGRAEAPIRLVCEVKRASPSKGMLNEAVDPVAMAALYARGGAAAISLVTEPDHFRGDPEWVDAVRPTTALPILMKDVVVDGYQLLDAALRGADAVLLIAALLSETQLQRLVSDARLLGLDPLVEIHDEVELSAAIRAGATVVGINNRDLRTFEVDPETAHRLLPRVPPPVTAVAESGLSRPEDLARLRATRCDAVLIGEAFMTSPDPAATLAALRAAAAG
jgi:indole-3-glycerol phosphate synthase